MTDDTKTTDVAKKGWSTSAAATVGVCGYLLGVVVGAWVATKNSPCFQHADDDKTIANVSRASASAKLRKAATAMRDAANGGAAVFADEAKSDDAVSGAGKASPAASSPGPTAPPVEEPLDLPAPLPPMSLPGRTLPTPRVPMPMEPVRAPLVTDEPPPTASEVVEQVAQAPRRPRPSTNGAGPRPRRGPKGASGAA